MKVYKKLKNAGQDPENFGSIGEAIGFLLYAYNIQVEVNPTGKALNGLSQAIAILRRQNENLRIEFEAEAEDREAHELAGKEAKQAELDQDLPY